MIMTRIKNFFKQLLLKESSPHKLSLALCVGIYVAFSPFPGFHTVEVIVFSWLLSLNFGIVLASSIAVNNPWTMVPVYGAGHVFGQWFCGKIMGVDMCVHNPTWVVSLNSTIAHYTGMSGISLWDFIIGGNLLGIGLALLMYPIFYYTFLLLLREKSHKVAS